MSRCGSPAFTRIRVRAYVCIIHKHVWPHFLLPPRHTRYICSSLGEAKAGIMVARACMTPYVSADRRSRKQGMLGFLARHAGILLSFVSSLVVQSTGWRCSHSGWLLVWFNLSGNALTDMSPWWSHFSQVERDDRLTGHFPHALRRDSSFPYSLTTLSFKSSSSWAWWLTLLISALWDLESEASLVCMVNSWPIRATQ